jgi:DHA2 family multidrug resistance protein
VSPHVAPVTSVGSALHSVAHPPLRLSNDALRPYVGIAGVLLGSIMATLGTRVTSLGIADLRGGLRLGFDEGAWMTTSFGVGQMLIGVCCPYLGGILGVRRVLLLGIVLFFAASLLAPLSPNLDAFITMQFLAPSFR